MTNALFRTEALEAASEMGRHHVVITLPRRHSRALYVLCGIVACVGSALLLCPLDQRSRVTGTLEPDKGVVNLYAPTPGTLLLPEKRQGDTVRKGELLFSISTAQRPQGFGDVDKVAEALASKESSTIGELSAQEASARSGQLAVRERLRILAEDKARLMEQLEFVGKRRAIAEAIEKDFSNLVKDGYISPSGLLAKSDALLDLRTREQEAQRSLLENQRLTAAAEADADSIKYQLIVLSKTIERQRDGIRQEIAALDAQRTTVVSSPVDGIIGAVESTNATYVTQDLPVMAIVPDGARVPQIVLDCDESTITFLKVGQSLALRFSSPTLRDAGQVSGRIERISAVPQSSGVKAQGAAEKTGPVYKVYASVDLSKEQRARVNGRAGLQLEGYATIRQSYLVSRLLDKIEGRFR